MKRVQTYLLIFLLLIAHACNLDSPTWYSQPSFTVLFTSRGLNNPLQLPEGSQILLNANGGFDIQDEIFTLKGTQWTNGTHLKWEDDQQETSIVAIYPVYENKEYSSSNLYSNDGLEDILVAKHTFSHNQKIELQFSHLFAKLTIHVDETLLANLNEIHLTVPSKVSNISTTEGTLSITEESHTSIHKYNGTSEYSFLLPPLSDCILTLTLLTTDNIIYATKLPSHCFQSGIQYVCNLVPNDSRPGIRTAEDLIAFSQLINQRYTGTKTLDDFREEVNGRYIYRLLEDITLSEEECCRLQPIGGAESLAFKDIFDGEGHTISNLILPDQSALTQYTGLFGYIETFGVVKNVHITQATSVTQPSCNQMGVIAAKNYGTIDHCSVSNSTIYSVESGSAGLIASSSNGNIVNCYSQNNTIHVQSYSWIGGIAGTADGNIFNCFTQNNTFKEKGSKQRIGCIVGASTGRSLLNIENCYINHSKSNNYWGAAIGQANKVKILGFYYNKSPYYYEKTSTTATNPLKYDSSYCIESVPVTQVLNEWVMNANKEFTFKNWKLENGIIRFK